MHARLHWPQCASTGPVQGPGDGHRGLLLLRRRRPPWRRGEPALPVQIPGLNTLGASHARVDVPPGAVFPPHYHPRASETAVVLDGAVYFGFVTSYPDNRVDAKVLRKGDVFAVPQGLVHFLYNNGTAPAALYATLSSQNPGLVLLADALFGAGLPDDLLAKTFLTDLDTAHKIGAKFRS